MGFWEDLKERSGEIAQGRPSRVRSGTLLFVLLQSVSPRIYGCRRGIKRLFDFFWARVTTQAGRIGSIYGYQGRNPVPVLSYDFITLSSIRGDHPETKGVPQKFEPGRL